MPHPHGPGRQLSRTVRDDNMVQTIFACVSKSVIPLYRASQKPNGLGKESRVWEKRDKWEKWGRADIVEFSLSQTVKSLVGRLCQLADYIVSCIACARSALEMILEWERSLVLWSKYSLLEPYGAVHTLHQLPVISYHCLKPHTVSEICTWRAAWRAWMSLLFTHCRSRTVYNSFDEWHHLFDLPHPCKWVHYLMQSRLWVLWNQSFPTVYWQGVASVYCIYNTVNTVWTCIRHK